MADDWQPIATAPWNRHVWVKTESMKFKAVLMPEWALNTAGEYVDQWCAVDDGVHPDCWSGGECWRVNEDEVASEPPLAWREIAHMAGQEVGV